MIKQAKCKTGEKIDNNCTLNTVKCNMTFGKCSLQYDKTQPDTTLSSTMFDGAQERPLPTGNW